MHLGVSVKKICTIKFFNMENDILLLFDNFLFNKLSEEERSNFETRLNTEPEFKKEFDEYLAIVEGINIYGHSLLKQKLEALKLGQIKKETKIKHLRIAISIAAVLVILMIPGFFLYQHLTINTRLYNKYYIEDNGLPVLMGFNKNVSMNEAMIEYKDKKYSIALKKLETIKTDAPNNDTVLFYTGMCHLQLKDKNKAVENFLAIIDKNAVYYYASMYYTALTYIKDGNFEKGNAYLNEVIQCQNCIYKNYALSLLDEIN